MIYKLFEDTNIHKEYLREDSGIHPPQKNIAGPNNLDNFCYLQSSHSGECCWKSGWLQLLKGLEEINYLDSFQ